MVINLCQTRPVNDGHLMSEKCKWIFIRYHSGTSSIRRTLYCSRMEALILSHRENRVHWNGFVWTGYCFTLNVFSILNYINLNTECKRWIGDYAVTFATFTAHTHTHACQLQRKHQQIVECVFNIFVSMCARKSHLLGWYSIHVICTCLCSLPSIAQWHCAIVCVVGASFHHSSKIINSRICVRVDKKMLGETKQFIKRWRRQNVADAITCQRVHQMYTAHIAHPLLFGCCMHELILYVNCKSVRCPFIWSTIKYILRRALFK